MVDYRNRKEPDFGEREGTQDGKGMRPSQSANNSAHHSQAGAPSERVLDVDAEHKNIDRHYENINRQYDILSKEKTLLDRRSQDINNGHAQLENEKAKFGKEIQEVKEFNKPSSKIKRAAGGWLNGILLAGQIIYGGYTAFFSDDAEQPKEPASVVQQKNPKEFAKDEMDKTTLVIRENGGQTAALECLTESYSKTIADVIEQNPIATNVELMKEFKAQSIKNVAADCKTELAGVPEDDRPKINQETGLLTGVAMRTITEFGPSNHR